MSEAKSNPVSSPEEERKLDQEVSAYEERAGSIEVKSDIDFAYAGELVKQVKTLQKKAEDYWEPMRASAYAAYQSVLNHKKEMVEPMKRAEKILKDKMSRYTMEQERRRRERERELRRLAQEEAERKLAEAVASEEKGDTAAAEYAMAEAEVMDDMARATVVRQPVPKAKGVSRSKTWKITGIDVTKVPVTVNGTVIRPVDERAIMRLIKASKGEIKIPGVRYEEFVAISVRA